MSSIEKDWTPVPPEEDATVTKGLQVRLGIRWEQEDQLGWWVVVGDVGECFLMAYRTSGDWSYADFGGGQAGMAVSSLSASVCIGSAFISP